MTDNIPNRLETSLLMFISLARISPLALLVSFLAIPFNILGLFLNGGDRLCEQAVRRCADVAQNRDVPAEARHLWEVEDHARLKMLARGAAMNITLPLWPFPTLSHRVHNEAAPLILRKWVWKLSQEA